MAANGRTLADGKLIMQINGIQSIHGAQSLQGPHSARPSGPVAGAPARSADQVDISPAAQAASEASEPGGIRAELVANLKSQIESGSYETAGKLEQAVDQLFDDLG